MAIILARKLVETGVDRTPMLSRYAVAALAMGAWAVLTAPTWIVDPLAPGVTFGAPGTQLLLLGAVGFVVLGTLYHVVPFIVWVHRYSDRLGLEPVPMIDDLYDDRVAAADFAALVAGVGTLAATDVLRAAARRWQAVALEVPSPVVDLAGAAVFLGALAFAGNLLLVVRRHGPQSIPGVLVGAPEADAGTATDGGTQGDVPPGEQP